MVRKTAFSRVSRRVPLVEQELINPSEAREFILVLLYCLFFFDLWVLITPLVYRYSNFSLPLFFRLLSLSIVSTMYICIYHHNIVDISDATDKKKINKDCLDGDIKMASLVLILIRS